MKTGILGGSFNPPHNGHIYLAKKAAEILKLDRIFIIPAGIPPHKELAEGADSNERFEMARLAFDGIMEYNVLDIEMNGNKPSYTSETLLKLKERYKDDTFYLIMGCDMFITLEKWYKPEMIFANSVLTVAARDYGETEKIAEYKTRFESLYNAKTVVLDIEPYIDSSTEVREMAEAGLDFSSYVPEKVYKYIIEKGLYNKYGS